MFKTKNYIVLYILISIFGKIHMQPINQALMETINGRTYTKNERTEEIEGLAVMHEGFPFLSIDSYSSRWIY